MALLDNDQSLNIVIKARNEASKVLTTIQKDVKSFSGKVEALRPTFQKMALAGGAAFTGIAAATKGAIDQAAKAEGSYNKFNTVFGEHADDMMSFVEDIRKEMPSATSEIVRMSADLQDLLVPMGVARGEGAKMTKGFVDLANKVAAFNDVDPTEVLEAIKSGLSGSSEPLRRFGINALETSLEARALKEGLIETGQTFKDLDPEVRNAIRAQALLSQAVSNSSDAINGFEENNDSFIRRQQELAASFQEVKEALGNTLLPIFDEVLKKILPIVRKIQEWVEQNPELARNIFIAVGALAALLTVVGLLGIALPAIITGFALLFSPVTAIVIAVAAVVAGLYKLIKSWDDVKASIMVIGEGIKEVIDEIVNFMLAAAEGIANAWVTMANTIVKALNSIQVKIPSWVPGIGGKSFGIDLPLIPKVNLPRYEHGGIVPGPQGMAVPIMAHGQERIIPANRAGRGEGNMFVINFNNPVVRSRDDVAVIKQQVEQAFRDVTRNHKLTTI